MSRDCAYSAPGKVLLAGGYLVLDRKYTGLVFGLDARIHVIARKSSGHNVVVRSPQFQDAIWTYDVDEDAHIVNATGSNNHFVQTAVAYACAYVVGQGSKALGPLPDLTVLADNAYYSNSENKTQTSRFQDFGKPISQVNKTGLGSSAAIVTALVAAVVSYCAPDSDLAAGLACLDRNSLRKLHNLAQIAHCAAQGKVGSGFDVASATYGSCKYRRFSPALLEDRGEPGTPGFAKALRNLVDEVEGPFPNCQWDHEIDSDVSIPQGLRLMMCDVDCGSKTPGMVRDVLNWRATNEQAATSLWDRLQGQNDALHDEMVTLARALNHDFTRLRQSIQNIRNLIRDMSRQAAVPVEPEEQTKLLDAMCARRGVIGGVVPGAGGYDAVTLLIEDREEVIQDLRDFLLGYDFGTSESRERGVKGQVKLLDVKGQTEGIKLETLDQYRVWLDP